MDKVWVKKENLRLGVSGEEGPNDLGSIDIVGGVAGSRSRPAAGSRR